MTAALALAVGVLFAIGTYLLLQRALTRIVIGLGLIGHGTNLLLLMVGGPAGRPPLIGPDGPQGAYADPLPQALALTAIVIAFGVSAFLLALAWRSFALDGHDEVEDDVEDRRVARLAGVGAGHDADHVADEGVR